MVRKQRHRTFLDLLALVDYDTETALVCIELMLSCRETGEELPPEVAQLKVG